MKSVITLLCVFTLLLVALAACGGGGEAPGVADPVATVERHSAAKGWPRRRHRASLALLGMELDLERETHTFDTVSDARIVGTGL